MTHPKTPVLLFAMIAPSPLAFAGNVLVVAPSGTPYSQIQTAVDAAHDGDTILVKSGSYLSFVVRDKELSIVADRDQGGKATGSIRVRGLAAGKHVLIAGFNTLGANTADVAEASGLYVKNCAGSVRVQDTSFSVAVPLPGPCNSTVHDVYVESCADVVLSDVFAAGQSATNGANCGDALHAIGSNVALFGGSFYGGVAASGTNNCQGYSDGGNGGNGVFLQDSFLFAADVPMHGGNGGDGLGFLGLGGDGGSGVVIAGTSTAKLRGDTLHGGSAGHASSQCPYGCVDGTDGAPIAGSNYEMLTNVGADFFTPSIVPRELETLNLTVRGLPGDFAYLYIARDTAFAYSSFLEGVVATTEHMPARIMVLGQLVGSGILATSLTIPSLPAGDLSRTQFLQVLTISQTGIRTIGSPLGLVTLDSSL